jgi:hypothetical protein
MLINTPYTVVRRREVWRGAQRAPGPPRNPYFARAGEKNNLGDGFAAPEPHRVSRIIRNIRRLAGIMNCKLQYTIVIVPGSFACVK